MKTRATVFGFLIVSAFLLPGCLVYNLEPLYESKDLLSEPDLSGVWKKSGEESKLTFVQNDSGTYDTIFDDGKGKKAKYICGLVKLNGRFFMDVTDSADPLSSSLDIKGRTIFRVVFEDKKIRLQLLSESWLEERLKKGKIKIKHFLKGYSYQIGDKPSDANHIVLTASTKELKKFIAKIANKNEAFTSGDEYIHKK